MADKQVKQEVLNRMVGRKPFLTIEFYDEPTVTGYLITNGEIMAVIPIPGIEMHIKNNIGKAISIKVV